MQRELGYRFYVVVEGRRREGKREIRRGKREKGEKGERQRENAQLITVQHGLGMPEMLQIHYVFAFE